MTDTVISAWITAGATIIAGTFVFFNHRSHAKRRPTESLQQQPETKSPDVAIVAAIVQAPPVSTAEPAKRRAKLTPKQMADAIDAVPPFQRDLIRKSFEGATVTWSLKLDSIIRPASAIFVTAEHPDGRCHVACETTKEESEAFNLVPEGVNFVVTGEIEEISRSYVRLRKCTFSEIGS